MHRKYWYWINNIEGIGNVKIRKLLERFGDPKEVFMASGELLEQVIGLKKQDIENILSDKIKEQQLVAYERQLVSDVHCVFPVDEAYPRGLKELYDKPYVLYYRGSLPMNSNRLVAIVGSRNCSFYGKAIAEELGRVLASSGFGVISGLALGIDVEAHKGSLMAGGRTYAVLAGSPEQCYPRQNYNTYMDIIRNGGVISEYNVGTRTSPGMFPLRNRIISGMCEAIIVVEAGKNSGSLITADYAIEQNKRVFAVPGRIGDKSSFGTNNLIWQGAEIITSYDNLLLSLGVENNKDKPLDPENSLNIALATNEKMLYNLLLDFSAKSFDTILEESKLPMNEVFSGLMTLEIKGLIKEVSKNFYVRIG